MALLVKIIRTNNQIMMMGLGEKAGTNVFFFMWTEVSEYDIVYVLPKVNHKNLWNEKKNKRSKNIIRLRVWLKCMWTFHTILLRK